MFVKSVKYQEKPVQVLNKGQLLLTIALVLPSIPHSALYILLSWCIPVIWLIYIIMNMMSATSRNKATGNQAVLTIPEGSIPLSEKHEFGIW